MYFWKQNICPTQLNVQEKTCVSHGSTESEIISLDAGLRLDGIPALDLWDLIVAVLHGNTNQKIKNGTARTRTLFVQHRTNFQRERNLME